MEGALNGKNTVTTIFIYKIAPSKSVYVNTFRNINKAKTNSPWIRISQKVLSGKFVLTLSYLTMAKIKKTVIFKMSLKTQFLK